MSQLSPRAAQVLAALVAEYIDTGEPVGSARLMHVASLGVSSATIRNSLAELEDLGYLQQPHTSAGRIPTDRGYRFYVDQLLAAPRSVRSGAAVEAQLRRDAGTPALAEDVLSAVSQVLSRASRLVAFALPMSTDGILKEIEFVPLSSTKVLVVVVADGGKVSRKAIDVGEEIDAHALRQASNYLNTEFAGMPLEHIRIAVMERLRHERTLADALRSRALKLALTGLEELPKKSPLFVDGASSLLDEAAGEDSGITLGTLSALLRMVEEKERLVKLLNEYMDGPGLTIVIGHEHRTPDLRPFSIIASTYADGTRRGTVGVIGPMRMHYSRTIAVVDGVALAVSRVLRDSM